MTSRRRWLTGNVLALGLVSMLTDASSEMILPLLPAFLVTLGAGAAALGVVEGVANGVAALLKLWAGRAADRWGRRRPLVVGGYVLSSLVRPLVALTVSPAQVLAVRVVDRVGKGLRSSPRDALLAASVAPGRRGAAFGFHRAMDHAGAFIGPLLAMAVIAWVSEDLRVVFALSAVPAALAIAVVALGVREAPPRAEVEAVEPGAVEVAQPEEAAAGPATGLDRGAVAAASGRGPALWRVVIPMWVFALGNASDTFLLLRAGEEGLDPVWVPLLWTGLHIVKSASALPGGRLSDRVSPRLALIVGWAWYALAYGLLAVVDGLGPVLAITLAYGLHHGLAEPAERVMVASVAPRGRSGEAFGWFHMGLSLASVVASVGFGLLWEHSGHAVAFGAGAALAGLASLLLVVLGRQR